MSDTIQRAGFRVLSRLSLLAVVVGVGSAAVPSAALAQLFVVDPYLQNASPDSIHVLWETSDGGDAQVDWGLTAELLDQVTVGDSFAGEETLHHDVRLEGLTAATRYFYRTTTGAASSDVFDFITPPDRTAEASFRLIAMSDMQRDWSEPDKFAEVISDGVLGFVDSEGTGDVAADVGLVLVAGDLVDNGWAYDTWAGEFFSPGAPLFAHAPVYPVLGNHESDTSFYFDYFHLPDNGTSGYEEHWWWTDYSNVRLIGLDSNSGYRIAEQLTWLDGVLAESCTDPLVDFVFAELHHPHLSELWVPGELDYTGDVITRLEDFSEACGKPSIHFFGHTHGYSRGQSRDHRHLWVNVATAGGNIDRWGEYEQRDYDEFSVSQDEWGFVVVEVDAGAEPKFRLRRVSRGNEDVFRDNEVRDDLTIRAVASGPSDPEGLSPQDGDDPSDPDGTLLVASTFEDSDGGTHDAAHWQVSRSCTDWSSPDVDRWRQARNEYGGVDLQAGDDLTDELVEGLEPQAAYCWRVRYRDDGLSWSGWSAAQAFATGGTPLSDNLLVNPGAEDGTVGWIVIEGFLESVGSGECGGITPHDGLLYFAIGGLCEEAAHGEARQQVDVSGHAEAIDEERVEARFGGWFADWSGDDLPQVRLIALDVQDLPLLEGEPIGAALSSWTYIAATLELPAGTRSIDFRLEGTRNAGTDNDSYLDDLELRLAIHAPGDDDDSATSDDDDSTPDPEVGDPPWVFEPQEDEDGCKSCGGDGDVGASLVVVLLFPLGAGRRRRRTAR